MSNRTFFAFFGNLGKGRDISKKAKANHSSRRLSLESLENRELLSANPLLPLDTGSAPVALIAPFSEVVAAAVEVPADHNAYEWNLVESQGLQEYATWEEIDGEERLVSIDASNKGLTGSLNLSNCTALTWLNCSSNQLTSLDVSGCTALATLDCSVNQLTFSTLPLINFAYTYDTQGSVVIPSSQDFDEPLDLSSEYLIAEYYTQYTWYYANGTVVDSSLYTEANGVFTFTGLQNGDVVYCTMTNDRFPSLTLQTTQMTINRVVVPLATPALTIGTTTSTTVALSWNAIAGADGYRIEKSNDNGTSWSLVENIANGSTTSTTATGLTANTDYLFRIKATGTGSYSDSDWSASKSATTDKITLSAPTLDITYTSNVSNIVSAQWSAVPNAGSYTVQYATNSAFTTDFGTVNTSATSTIITGFNANTTYYVRVMATGSGAYLDSGYSDTKTLTTLCHTPTNLQGTPSATSIALTWTEPAVGTVTSYKLERSTDQEIWTQIGGMITTESYNDNTPLLNPNTTYYYRVYAVNSAGAPSAMSAETNITTDTIKLTAPTLTIDTISIDSVALSWNEIAEADGYVIEKSSDNGNSWSLVETIDNGSTTSTTATGLAANTPYLFRVKATGSGVYGDSDWAISNSVTTNAIELSAPILAIGTPTSDSVPLSWNAIAGASGYEIEKSDDNGNSWSLVETIANGSTTSTTAFDLMANTDYLFRIKATGTGQYSDSDYSATQSATTLVSGIPQVNAVGQSGSVLLTWEAIADATAYRVYRLSDSGSFVQLTANITATTYVDYTARIGVTETYSVIALSGAWSDSQPVTATALPGTDIPQVTAIGQSASVLLSWAAASGATAYRVYRLSDSGSYVQLTANITATTYVDYAARIGVTETYSVIALNGTWSNSIPVTATALPGTGVPQVTAIGQSASVSLSWAAVSGATAYRVYRLGDTGSYVQLTANITETTYIDYAARIGVTETYSVIALNGTWSDSKPVTATALPGTGVPQVTAVGQPGSVSLTWDAIAGATAYRVYRLNDAGAYVQLTANITATTFVDDTARTGVTETYSVIALNGTWSDSKPVTATALPSNQLAVAFGLSDIDIDELFSLPIV